VISRPWLQQKGGGAGGVSGIIGSSLHVTLMAAVSASLFLEIKAKAMFSFNSIQGTA
jgi:hypothetical protein